MVWSEEVQEAEMLATTANGLGPGIHAWPGSAD